MASMVEGHVNSRPNCVEKEKSVLLLPGPDSDHHLHKLLSRLSQNPWKPRGNREIPENFKPTTTKVQRHMAYRGGPPAFEKLLPWPWSKPKRS